MTAAYLRISTSKQHIVNQRETIDNYAKRNNIAIDQWYSDVVSGKIQYDKRKLGDIIDSLNPSDIIIVTEISRLSRSLIEIMNIIHTCVERKITLHCIKEGYIFEDNLNSKILGFAFGLVAEIERNLISTRTKEALAVRKAAGIKLGRPAGHAPKSNILHQNRSNIEKMLRESVPHKTIAYKYKVSLGTLSRFIKYKLNESA